MYFSFYPNLYLNHKCSLILFLEHEYIQIYS